MTPQSDIPAPLKPAVQNRLPRFASLRTIVALMLREMSTTYGRSPGGYLWAVLEPIAGIGLLTLIFGLAFRSPALGVSFAMFYATGMLPFMMFTDISNKLGHSLNFSKNLLSYPRVTFFDAVLARFLVNLVTQIMVSYLIILGILLTAETRVTPDPAVIIKGYLYVALLSLGVGMFNCFMMVRFPLYKRFWGVLMRPMFILSSIFFLFEMIPQPYQDYLWFNPLVHVIGLVRSGFYGSYDAHYVSEAYILTVSLTTLSIGMLMLRRYHKSTLER
ncbi:ABC transporter permease [Pseudooctadecabacter sp.]|uniref:ABC transporter permease n=1 Tax=Pseudooctadecabacter sp. TaxID=1966338 RepID=UPI003F6AA592